MFILDMQNLVLNGLSGFVAIRRELERLPRARRSVSFRVRTSE
jgi:hypothetical protein